MKIFICNFCLVLFLCINKIDSFDLAGIELPDIEMPEMPEFEMPNFEMPDFEMPELPGLPDFGDSIPDVPNSVNDLPAAASNIPEAASSLPAAASSIPSSLPAAASSIPSSLPAAASSIPSAASNLPVVGSSIPSKQSETKSYSETSPDTTTAATTTTASSGSRTTTTTSSNVKNQTNNENSDTSKIIRRLALYLLPYENPKVKKAIETCRLKVGNSTEQALILIRRDSVKNTKDECYLGCVKQEAEVIGSDNRFNMTIIKERLSPLKDTSSKWHDYAIKVHEYCSNAANNTNQLCTASRNMRLCVASKINPSKRNEVQ